jgi:hypothetical protein
MQSRKKQKQNKNKRNKGHTFKNKTGGGDKGARLARFVKSSASTLRPGKVASVFKSAVSTIKNTAKMAVSGKYSLKKEFIETIKTEMETMLLTFERVGFKIPKEEQAGAEEVDGDRVDGDRVDGDRVDGDRVDGDRVDGDRVDGDRVDGVDGVERADANIVDGVERADANIVVDDAEQADAVRIAAEKQQQEDNARTVEADARRAGLEKLKLAPDALQESIEAARVAAEDAQRTENSAARRARLNELISKPDTLQNRIAVNRTAANTMSDVVKEAMKNNSVKPQSGNMEGGALPNNSPEKLQAVYDILDDFNKIRNKHSISNDDELTAAKEYETKFASYVKFLEFIKKSISESNLTQFQKEQCIKVVDKQIVDINMIIEENASYIQLFTFGAIAPKSKPVIALDESEQVLQDTNELIQEPNKDETKQTIQTLIEKITELEAKLESKDSELAAKDSELAAKDSELAAKDSELVAKNSELETEQQKIVTEMSKKPEYETFNITDEIQNEIPLLVKDVTKGNYMLHVVMGTDKVRLWYALQDGSNPTIKYEVTGDLGFKEARNKLEAAVKEKNAAAASP